MRRKPDEVKVEAVGLGTLDRFTSLEIAQDLTGPTTAGFEVGDDATWNELRDFVEMGTAYRVFVNNRPVLTGRIEARDVPTDVGSGTSVRFTVRTKLADAMYASADPKTRVKDVAIKDFLLALYAPLGYTEADFVFDADVSRNLVTGKSKTTGKAPVDLEPMKEDQAKVQPPESIYAAADRHLRRFGLMHWDSPDGRIVVGAPNDEQDPLYRFTLVRKPAEGQNNVLGMTRVQDWSELATILGVFGTGGKSDYSRAKVRAFAQDDDAIAAGFYRPVVIVADGVNTQALAERAARRELSARSKLKDAWEISVDGLSFWDGASSTNYAIDTVADVFSDLVAGTAGAYYVHRVTMRRDAQNGDTTTLSAIAKGVWVL